MFKQRKEHPTNIKLLLIAAAIVIAPASANADETIASDHEIHGFTTFELVSSLQECGIDAEHVEAWGDAIRVDAIDATGRPYMVMLDKNTLQPFGDKAVNILPVPVSQVSGFQWPVIANAAPHSLVSDSEGDGSTE